MIVCLEDPSPRKLQGSGWHTFWSRRLLSKRVSETAPQIHSGAAAFYSVPKYRSPASPNPGTI